MDKELFDDLVSSLREAVDIKQGRREPARTTSFSKPNAEAVRDDLESNRENVEPVVLHTFDSGKKFDMSLEDIKEHLADSDEKYLDEKQDEGSH